MDMTLMRFMRASSATHNIISTTYLVIQL